MKVTGESAPAMPAMPATMRTAQIHGYNAMFHLVGFFPACDQLYCTYYNSKLASFIL